MAKQITAPDPVSAAMSAIESALNLTDEDEAALASGESAPLPPLAPAKSTSTTPVLKPSAPRRRDGDAPSSWGGAAGGRLRQRREASIPAAAPANDDRATVGAILQAMNARPPSRTPFILALFASLVWAAICALYGYVALWPPASGRPIEMLLRPEALLVVLTALGPILFMFAFAALARRLGELRQSARAISQVAVRLAEPETMAGEHVANLSQAIRRELTSMGDGVERALARAAELETRVRSEVSTLERSYSDNERKIRLLIAEMADQRESIVTSGTRVRDAITIAHDASPSTSIPHGANLSDRIADAGQRLSGVSRRLHRRHRPCLGPHRLRDARAHRRGRRADERVDRRHRRKPCRAPRRHQPEGRRRHPRPRRGRRQPLPSGRREPAAPAWGSGATI